MRAALRWWKGALIPHHHDFRLGESFCRVFGCSAQQIIHEHDKTLSILEAALKQRRITDLALWLMVPRGSDGVSAAEALSGGEYNRARMMAYTNYPGEMPRRRRAPQEGT